MELTLIQDDTKERHVRSGQSLSRAKRNFPTVALGLHHEDDAIACICEINTALTIRDRWQVDYYKRPVPPRRPW